MYCKGQEHIGLCFITSHLAPTPQVPRQGLIHFWLLQASFSEHSALIVHSGRHEGGLPMYVGRQEQTAWLLISLHWLFCPHGLGLQGRVFATGTMCINLLLNILSYADDIKIDLIYSLSTL